MAGFKNTEQQLAWRNARIRELEANLKLVKDHRAALYEEYCKLEADVVRKDAALRAADKRFREIRSLFTKEKWPHLNKQIDETRVLIAKEVKA